MIALPLLIAFTLPDLSTVTMLVSLLSHLIVLSVASVGATVALSVVTSFVLRLRVVLLSVTDFTSCLTVTVHFAVKEPSSVLTVITAEPALTPVTTPSELTFAIAVSDDDQLILRLFASSGRAFAVRAKVFPV